MMKQLWIRVLLPALLLLIGTTPMAAQATVVQWSRYDVNITIQQNSGVSVEEVHEVSLASGATTFQRVIPTDKLVSISNIQVLEFSPTGGQRGYQQADTQAEYTFELLQTGDRQTIQLYFPPNNVASTRFVLRYFVAGSLRFYDEGDQFDWRPFGEGAAAPVAVSSITVNLPATVPQDQLSQSSRGVYTENFVSDGDTVLFRASNVLAGDNLEISLTFPHGLVQGSAPPWQRQADISPYIQWGSIVLGVLFLLLGLAAAFGWWYLKLRVAPDSSQEVPQYIRTPPSKLSPAAAGALLDGSSSPRHVMATLLDLAAHGALNVYSGNRGDGAAGDSRKDFDFDLYGVDQDKAVRAYETTLYGKIFGYLGAKKRNMLELRRALYMATPELKTQIDVEITEAGYLAQDIGVVRRQYAAFGGAGIIVSLLLALVVGALLSRFTLWAACPFLSLALGAAAFIGAGLAKSKRTQAGQTEAVRWEAFRRYLKDLTPQRAAKARRQFHLLLPYAMAFGLEKQVVEKFAAANTATPKWWSVPAEKLPNTDHEDAHAWVSASIVSEPKPEPRAQKRRTKSVIRRLGAADEGDEPAASLKNIRPNFLAFLSEGLEIFAKAPAIAEEEVDFDSLGHDEEAS